MPQIWPGVQDALDEIARQKPRDVFKPLRVHFIGEDGIDAGGVKKEFFQLLVTELLCPDYGMLIFQSVCDYSICVQHRHCLLDPPLSVGPSNGSRRQENGCQKSRLPVAETCWYESMATVQYARLLDALLR